MDGNKTSKNDLKKIMSDRSFPRRNDSSQHNRQKKTEEYFLQNILIEEQPQYSNMMRNYDDRSELAIKTERENAISGWDNEETDILSRTSQLSRVINKQ